MSQTADIVDAPVSSRLRLRGNRAAVWALVCGLYAGALWAAAWYAMSHSDEGAFSRDPAPRTAKAATAWAMLGGAVGCPVGPIIFLFRPRRLPKALALLILCPLWGSLGCGSAALAAVLLRDVLNPLLSSSLAMAAVSAVVGYTASRLSARLSEPDASRKSQFLVIGLGWAFSGGAITGAAWLAACVFAQVTFGVVMPFELTAFRGVLMVGCGATYGAVGGTLVGLYRPADERRQTSLALAFLGVVFGALAGIAVTLALSVDHVRPLLNSTLAMSAVGFAAGLCGYQFAPPPAQPDEPPYEEDEPDAPAVRIEWLLCEEKRPWRIGRPLARVLPVLAVAVAALVWGTLASNAALIAVAALGFAGAHALYRQEKRLGALERRYGSGRDSRPPDWKE